jgi:hypothetical protein
LIFESVVACTPVLYAVDEMPDIVDVRDIFVIVDIESFHHKLIVREYRIA